MVLLYETKSKSVYLVYIMPVEKDEEVGVRCAVWFLYHSYLPSISSGVSWMLPTTFTSPVFDQSFRQVMWA